jgi:hypothetical protein
MRYIILLFICTSVGVTVGQSWSYLGACCIEPSVDALSSAGSEDLAFLDNGTPVVSHFRQTGGSTTGKVYQFTGSSWEQVGPDLPNEGTISAIDLETHGLEIYVSVLYNATQIHVYLFNGSDWEQQGPAISGNLAYEFIINNDGDLFVFNTLDQKVREFNGIDWETVLSLTESSSPFWGGDQTVVCDDANVFYYIQPFLNLSTFAFENYVHAFDGISITPTGDLLFSGFGTPGKLAFNQAGILHGQYQSDGTNKILQLDGSSWVQLLDTTNAINGLFGFNYIFNSSDELILSVFTNVYEATGYTALPAIEPSGTAISINNMVVAPNGQLHITFGEIGASGGVNFSVMVFQDAVAITEQSDEHEIQLYPNPSSGTIQLTNLEQGDHLFIYDMQGKILFQQYPITNHIMTINQHFTPGQYLLMIHRQGQVKTTFFQTN